MDIKKLDQILEDKPWLSYCLGIPGYKQHDPKADRLKALSKYCFNVRYIAFRPFGSLNMNSRRTICESKVGGETAFVCEELSIFYKYEGGDRGDLGSRSGNVYDEGDEIHPNRHTINLAIEDIRSTYRKHWEQRGTTLVFSYIVRITFRGWNKGDGFPTQLAVEVFELPEEYNR